MTMQKKRPRTGRPRKTDDSSSLYDSKLYKLLKKKLPARFVSNDKIAIRKLAEALDVHHYTIYRWMGDDASMSVGTARKLLGVSDKFKGSLKREDLLPFTASL